MRRRPHYRRLPGGSRHPWSLDVRATVAVALVVALLPAVSVLGLVSASITIDGNMDDWAGVLSSADNTMSDPVGTADPDNPGTANRDVNLFGYTWDTDNVYLYIRRTSTGTNSVHYLAYVDVDNSGTMSDIDRVVDFDYNGTAFQQGASGAYAYVPVNPTGDPLSGDGQDMPGSLGAPIAGTLEGSSASDGIRHECSVPWSMLGVPTGSPIVIKLSCSLNTNLPSSIQDNTGLGSLVSKQASLTPGTTQGGLAGGSVSFTHTLRNDGNVTDTYALTAISSRGWPLTMTDTSGVPLSSASLAAGASIEVVITETIPAGTADGVRDTLTLRATGSGGYPTVTATNTSVAGELIVIPDLTNSVSPDNVSVFNNMLQNNSEQLVTVAVSVASNKGYAAAVFAPDGITPLAEVTLPPGGSTPVRVHVTIPPGAPIGSTDLTTIRVVGNDDPTIQNSGTDTTHIREPLTVAPNNSGAAGAGTSITYLHTVTNSTPDTMTVGLSAASAWPVQVLDAAGVTQISSVVLPPFGGSTQVRVRVAVPVGTPSGSTDVATLTATGGGLTATATDNTTVAMLVLFSDGAYTSARDEYLTGETVYARGSALSAGSTVRFRWLDPSGAIAGTSPDVTVDVNRQAGGSFDIPTVGPPGVWNCVVVSTKGVELTPRVPFYVGYRGHIETLSAADVASAAGSISVQGTYANDGAAPINGTSVDYLVWYDADTDGVLSAGDQWVTSAGAVQPYTGIGTESTHLSTGFAVPAGGSWSEAAPWTVTAANLPNPGVYHVTAEWHTADGHLIDVRDVTFNANVYRISLTVSDHVLDAGAVEPDVTVPLTSVNVSVDSNSPFDLYKTLSATAADLGLATTLPNQYSQPSGVRVYTDSYSVTVPWTTNAGPVSATVTYTAVTQ